MAGDQQSDIFALVESSDSHLAQYAELCNALYEREILALAYHGPKQMGLMRRRLAGLSFHIKRIALHLCQHDAPLVVDYHNGSWQAKQALRPPGRQPDPDKTLAWYQKHAAAGLIVPLLITSLDGITLELDSIDRVDVENKAIHANKYGWFSFDGAATECRIKHCQAVLLKPTKAIMQAGCCGHMWNQKSKLTPRALSLREMTLSTQIDWRTFRLKPVV